MKITETLAQFYQHFTKSFYMQRSRHIPKQNYDYLHFRWNHLKIKNPKVHKIQSSRLLFCAFGICAGKMLLKSTQCRNPQNIMLQNGRLVFKISTF